MTTERFKVPPNSGRSASLLGGLKQQVKYFLDLQVATVVSDIKPWLETRTGSLLEVGCGDQPYRHFVSPDCAYTGLDWERAKTSFAMEAARDVVYYAGDRFPFEDATFDNLFHTEVLEHVVDYAPFLAECRRVLKPGAPFLFSVPFQARFHFIPHDYWRFTPSGLETIVREAGFTDIVVKPRGTDVTVALYKAIAVSYRLAFGRPMEKLAFAAASPAAIAMLAMAHASVKYEVGSKDDCLGYTVYAKAA